MIDVINRIKANQEDDLEVCEMEIDKAVDEIVTETSENDISQDSQVMRLCKCKIIIAVCIVCRYLV